MAYGQDPYGQQGQGGYGQPPQSGAGYGQPAAGNVDEIGLTTGRIVLTFILCWPFAIPAMIANGRVKDKLAQGDTYGAQNEGQDAKKWAKIGTIIGSILWGISLLSCCAYVIFVVILAGSIGAAGAGSSYDYSLVTNLLALLPV